MATCFPVRLPLPFSFFTATAANGAKSSTLFTVSCNRNIAIFNPVNSDFVHTVNGIPAAPLVSITNSGDNVINFTAPSPLNPIFPHRIIYTRTNSVIFSTDDRHLSNFNLVINIPV